MKKFTYVNSGNTFEFNPIDKMYLGKNSPPVKAYDFYVAEVKLANRPDVYLIDDHGEYVEV